MGTPDTAYTVTSSAPVVKTDIDTGIRTLLRFTQPNRPAVIALTAARFTEQQ